MAFDENKVKEFFKQDRFAATNGIELLTVNPGYAEAKMTITPNLCNGLGAVMGGAIFTLADFAFAAATNSRGFATVTCSSTINYFCPPKGEYMLAKASEISSSRKLCTFKVDIVDAEENFVAQYIANGYIKSQKLFED